MYLTFPQDYLYSWHSRVSVFILFFFYFTSETGNKLIHWNWWHFEKTDSFKIWMSQISASLPPLCVCVCLQDASNGETDRSHWLRHVSDSGTISAGQRPSYHRLQRSLCQGTTQTHTHIYTYTLMLYHTHISQMETLSFLVSLLSSGVWCDRGDSG